MKRSDLIHCICFAFICWISGSVALEICSKVDWSIMSVFNLQYDVILQIQSPELHLVQFWRISNIADETPTLGELGNDPREHYYDHGFVVAQEFEEKRPIFGYVTPITRTEEWAKKQGLTGEDLEQFKKIISDENKYFVCLHGTAIGTYIKSIQTYIYTQNENIGLSSIPTAELQLFLRQRCRSNQVKTTTDHGVFNMRILSFTNFPEDNFNNDAFGTITIVGFDSTPEQESDYVAMLTTVNGPNGTIETWDQISREYHYFIFQYTTYYRFLVCRKNCTLKTGLSWFIPGKDNNTGSPLFERNYSNLTISMLLGCGRLHPEPDLNSFCNNSENFQSIFSLGKDLYFQKESRFWRLPHNRFNKGSNKDLLNYQMRLESDMGELLIRYKFDLSYPVSGFSYRMNKSDWCDQDNHECHEQHKKSRSYFGVCMYGTGVYFNKIEGIYKHSSKYATFFLTPYGLYPFRKKLTSRIYQVSYTFCGDMWANNEPFVAITGSDVMKPNSNGRAQSDYDVVYILAEKDRVVDSGPKVIKRANWLISEPLTDKQNFVIKYESESKSLKSIFFLWNILYSYDSTNLYKYGVPLIDGTQRRKSESLQLYEWFDCPFNTIASTVRLYKEKVCDNNHKHLNESVFTVGTKLYHQRDKYFYEWKNNSQTFVYDHSITNLLNDYFDTTYRLTAYSLEKSSNEFTVVFHGKNSENVKYMARWGKWIWALFKYDQNTNILKVEKESKIAEKVTIGYIIPKLSIYDFVDGMGGMVTKETKNNVIVLVNDEKGRFYFDLMIQNSTLDLPDPDSRKLEIFDYDYLVIDFEDIVGIYNDINTRKLMLVAHDKNQFNALMVYHMDPVNMQFDSKIIELKDVYPSQGISYFQRFCSVSFGPRRSKSDSKSSSKTLSYILGVLLIILLILSFAVGFYMSGQKENIHSIEDSNVDTLAENRNNSQVVGQHNSERQSSKGSKSGAKNEKNIRSERI